jgi:hypothetical protein
LDAASVAVLANAAQFEADVALVTCTVAVAPDARFPKLQLKLWLVIEHVPGPLYAGLMLQAMPVPVGSGSLSDTDKADAAPVFPAVSV